ncbi:unnamed protein product [Fusarium graminearum]|nr:unnamed protein product [Fusarium graminearum]
MGHSVAILILNIASTSSTSTSTIHSQRKKKDTCGDPKQPPPFKILDATKDPIYSIPLHHLETDIEFLFHEIQVPDIISRLETGECRFCNSKGVYQQYEASFVVSFLFFTFLPIRHSDCYFDVLCPLCIGLDYAEMCFYERCSCLRTEKIMPDEEYYNRVKKRFKELGYALL